MFKNKTSFYTLMLFQQPVSQTCFSLPSRTYYNVMWRGMSEIRDNYSLIVISIPIVGFMWDQYGSLNDDIGGKMILFRCKNELKYINEKPFKLERDIQHLVESNLESIFGLQLIASEFKISNFNNSSHLFFGHRISGCSRRVYLLDKCPGAA